MPATSEVFDLKPTSEYRGVGVEFVDGDHPGATRRARHTGSGVSGPSVSERLYWQTGHRAGPSVLHAGAVGQARCFARCTGQISEKFREAVKALAEREEI